MFLKENQIAKPRPKRTMTQYLVKKTVSPPKRKMTFVSSPNTRKMSTVNTTS